MCRPVEVIGKVLYESVNPALSSCCHRGFQGTRLFGRGIYDEGWSPIEVAKQGGVLTVSKDSFFVVPASIELARRIAATWARHQEDSVLVEVASDVRPKESAIGGGVHFFLPGTVLHVVRINELSEEWKARANPVHSLRSDSKF